METDKYGDIYLSRKSRRGLKKPYSGRTIGHLRHFISGDVLEIGPGTGDNINLLFNRSITRYTALEPDRKLFLELQKNLQISSPINLYRNFFPDGILKETFDTIISFEVIEHISSPLNFLEECKKILRPGGHIIISTPNKYVYRLVANLVDGGPDPTHINEMTFHAFRKLFEQFFETVYSNYTLPLLPRLSERLASEQLFVISENAAKILRFVSLNVLLVGKSL